MSRIGFTANLNRAPEPAPGADHRQNSIGFNATPDHRAPEPALPKDEDSAWRTLPRGGAHAITINFSNKQIPLTELQARAFVEQMRAAVGSTEGGSFSPSLKYKGVEYRVTAEAKWVRAFASSIEAAL